MDFRKIVRNQNLLSGVLLVLLGIICLFTLLTNGMEEGDARTGGALL